MNAYGKVYVKVIFWLGDYIEITEAQNLTQAFESFGYEVEVIALPYVGSLGAHLKSIILEPRDLCANDLQVWCYVGGIQVLNTRHDDLTSIPYWEMKNGMSPCRPTACSLNWLPKIAFQAQHSDSLVILDSYLGTSNELQDFLQVSTKEAHSKSSFRFKMLCPWSLRSTPHQEAASNNYLSCLEITQGSMFSYRRR